MLSSPRKIIVLFLLLAALGILSFQYRYGIGVTPDSALFESAANSLLTGNGLTTDIDGIRSPLTHHPPLYPALLAVGKEISGSFLTAATAINFISFLSCVLGMYMFARRNAPPGWAIAAVLLLVCSTALYSVDYILGTDGLAIPFMLAGMYGLSEFERTKSPRSLVLAGLALSAATLTRYAYVAFIPAGCLVILVDEDLSLLKRLRSLVLLGAFACGPILLVMLHNVVEGGSATNRTLTPHLVSPSRLFEGADYLSSWLLPYRFPVALRTLALGAVVALGIVLAIRSPLKNALRITTLSLFGYVILLLVSISLVDTATPLDERLLAPVVVILCLHLTLISSWLWTTRSRLLAACAGFLVLTPCCVGMMHLLPETAALYKHKDQGRSLAELRDDFRDILPALDKLPADAPIYSNVAKEIYLVSGRQARDLPTTKGYTDGRPRTEAEISAQVRDLKKEITRSNGLVIFDLRPKTLFDQSLIGRNELSQRISLEEVLQSPGFAVYKERGVTPTTARGAAMAAGTSVAIGR
ncbi:MAG: glycosyltransferase family 39 protein [Acidobacteriota bacterium]|nr:glycosyltransferase family 39 protein [Acidobacteriota bacterium]